VAVRVEKHKLLLKLCFSGLPSKSKQEEKRHRKMYEAVVESAKRKGEKCAFYWVTDQTDEPLVIVRFKCVFNSFLSSLFNFFFRV